MSEGGLCLAAEFHSPDRALAKCFFWRKSVAILAEWVNVHADGAAGSDNIILLRRCPPSEYRAMRSSAMWRTFSTFTKAFLPLHNGYAPRRCHALTSSLASFRKMATSSSPALAQPVKLACIQLASGSDKAANLAHARDKVLEAAAAGAKIIVLPECFNSPYGTNYFPAYAETLLPSPPTPEQSPTFHALSAMAKEANAYLVGGSLPELVADAGAKGDTYYNTSLTFSPEGKLLATHRKVHLFDIDIPGKITFRESDVLSPGNKVTIVDLPPYGKIGIAICYDIRFPELGTIASRKGAFALIYPGAFNTTTGPLHWRLQGQARAMDNQLYVALCSPARDTSASYHAWGHSLVADPMAAVLVEAEETETIVYAELDGAKIAETRKNIPLETQRRFDVYPDVSAEGVKLEES
ncbi:carbon-nitrogen hydrolase [Thozetella sp. PMI_491]|nr:carbon-nitrogen hydrolase [Thozetella sp. PMI_491]